MNILFVLENYHPHIGGVEIVFKTLCEGLARSGHDITVVTHRPKGAKKKETLNRVRIHRIDCMENRYLFTLFCLPKVLELASRADIIHTTTFNAAPPAWLAGKIRGRPVVLTVHEVWIGKWNKLTDMGPIPATIHDILERIIYVPDFDRYICVSGSTKKQLDAIKNRPKASVIYNGIDYHHFDRKRHLPASKKIRKTLGLDSFTVLVYGRPGASKGIDYAIKAFPKVQKKVKDARLLLILSKDRDYKERYLRIKKMVKGMEGVILHDPVPWKDLPAYILASDCVVVPSLAEGFGFSAAESCALGQPVIASDTTSLPEVVSGRYALVPPRDPDKIAEAVITAATKGLKDHPKKTFSWDKNLKETISLYKSLRK